MACRQMLAVLAVAMVAMATVPAMARATEYVVGDDMGWGLQVNYTDWARGKVFRVGDSLVFRYKPGNHNVLRVSGPDFQACNKVSAREPLASGDDAVPLSSPGKRWYVCGKAEHCESGQKLVITVLPSLQAPAASPTPPAPVTGSSSRITVPGHQSLMVVFVAVLTTFITCYNFFLYD